jgi:hypothetical protein
MSNDPVESHVTFSTTADQIDWLMPWSHHEEGRKDEIVFEPRLALAVLLMSEVVFMNNFWWEKELPKHLKGIVSLHVNCNDVFAWGCADSEDLLYEDIEGVYRAFLKDGHAGVEIWCIRKRGVQPQRPVLNALKAAGLWTADLDTLPRNPDNPEEPAKEEK